ncbi:NAD(P)-dependent alcohol dehydrogenase [candidate division KSB3 bacterium]|uniref:NAD(P)-dependent alcohol dehydrogenase n=1 Tax=candidate division KSB3 bacterium TaxID=2044937 RepID=A0A2G6K8Z4_9BACT|nr:MAG: NAD(P)-dependent alcohol dehydrogenase [candidate division KSB3 bacterium]
MKALVLEKVGDLSLRDIEIEEQLGTDDVRIALKSVGVCGSDVHYYTHGAIGPFVVNDPMVLGHEAAGEVIEVGANVTHLKVGDRVCMEPGIPNPRSKASKLGLYNLDPAVVFWATPPVHGCLRTSVVHPAEFTFKLPDNISYEEGAMVEPLAIGMHAAVKARITPGDVAVVTGAGTIGVMTCLAALAGGCSQVIISDIRQEKLDLLQGMAGVHRVNVAQTDLLEFVQNFTEGWGADIVFEASGSAKVASTIFDYLRPGGHLVYIGMPVEPIQLDIVQAQAKEIQMDTIFRYANVYDRALQLMASRKIDLKPFITERYSFDDSIAAFEYAKDPKPSSVKVQILFD